MSLGRFLHLSKLRFPHPYLGGESQDPPRGRWEHSMRTLAWHVVSTREKLVTTMIMTHGWELLSPVRSRVPRVPPCVGMIRLDERRAGQGGFESPQSLFLPWVGSYGSLWGGSWVEMVLEPDLVR